MAKWEIKAGRFILLKEDDTYQILDQKEIMNTEIWKTGKIYSLGQEQKLTLSVENFKTTTRSLI